MRYCPVSSVTPVRTLVMSAGLDTSIVTPGSTAPDVSRTVPARLCAVATLCPAASMAITANDRISSRFMTEHLNIRLRIKESLVLDAANLRTMGPSDHWCQAFWLLKRAMDDEPDLRERLLDSVPDYARPRRYRRGDQLPSTA